MVSVKYLTWPLAISALLESLTRLWTQSIMSDQIRAPCYVKVWVYGWEVKVPALLRGANGWLFESNKKAVDATFETVLCRRVWRVCTFNDGSFINRASWDIKRRKHKCIQNNCGSKLLIVVRLYEKACIFVSPTIPANQCPFAYVDGDVIALAFECHIMPVLRKCECSLPVCQKLMAILLLWIHTGVLRGVC